MTTTPDDGYAPTTEQVRDAWSFASDLPDDRLDFDRWLAEVRASAWDEGWATAEGRVKHLREDRQPNPYRQEESR